MANKETFRTLNKLWLINFCAVTIIIALQLSSTLASDTKEEALQNVTSIESNSTSQKPIAEPLIRYRRQPPRTVVKHIIRPKRYKMKRVKRPKIKYSFAEPPPTYYTRKPIHIKKPTFDSSIFDDFSHMNVESADFDLPPSSYETQSMDLDLYKHYEPSIEAASYKEIRKPSWSAYAEPAYSENLKTYSAPEISLKDSYATPYLRQPHTKYGVPTEYVYSSGYDKPSNNKYAFEAPAKNEYSHTNPPSKEVLRIPATTYGVPDLHIPTTGSNDYNKYSVVEQKPPYASHAPTKIETYHFAEPPQPEPKVEITYSPSYEINIPSRHENSYQVEHHTPPQHPSPPQHPPTSYDESSYQEQPRYEEPPQQYHPPPANYQPTNSYESPPQENYEDTAPTHQHVSGTNQPASYQPAPPRHQIIDDYIPRSQELPIDANHKQPPYDFPKSSYEVPIYDPVPFDASSHQESEIYPPHSFDRPSPNKEEYQPPPDNSPEKGQAPSEQTKPNEVQSSDTRPKNTNNRPQSPISHLSRTRKKQRTRGSTTTVSTTRHILDVPELQEAFEKENRMKYDNSQEPDVNESQRFEEINKQKNNDNNINDIYSKGPWNPMKIRTSPIILVSTPSSMLPMKVLAAKNKRYHHKQQRTSTTPVIATTTTTTSTSTTTTEVPAKVEILSIEKSKSKAYYDGVLVSTPKISKIYNTNFFRNRFRLENTNTSTAPQQPMKSIDENGFSKRTTNNVFDTTIFKSPFNEADRDDVHRHLPKNHKLF